MSAPRRLSAEAILAELGAAEQLAALHAESAPAVDDMWEPPVPLSPRRLLPVFPVDALPGWVAEQVAAVAEFTQTPPDLPGCIALAALSTAAGGRAVVEVRDGWREQVNIFTVVVMPPGSRKSAVFAAMTAPLLAAERNLIETTKPRIVEAELAKRVAVKTAEKAANTAANAPGGARPEALAEAGDAAMQAEAITVPVLPRLLADDITPEAAATLLAEQGGRLAVLSAEGGIFATLAGRYSSGAPNLEIFLKGHAGDMLRVDRKGRPAEHVDHPALTLGLAIQPEVLADIARMPGFRGRGLLARILYSLPENLVGRRRIGAPPVPAAVAEAYASNLKTRVCSLAEWTDPAVLPLTPEAAVAVLELEAAIEPRLSPDGDLGHLADWGSKLVGATARLAGLLHLTAHLRDGWGRPIDVDTMTAGIRLGHYYLAHALAAFDHMGADPVTDDARHVLGWISRTQPERFTRRELFSALDRGRFRKVTDLDPALELLEGHGHIRRIPEPERSGRAGRPPSPGYLVHPQYHSALSAQSAKP